MPYENSLVVLSMNGPQLKAVLERAYRNYYYYKYVAGYGGYSYYTTCMLMPDAGNEIIYYDGYPALPDLNNVAGLTIQGVPVDFNDAATYYRVATVNYLAAGSCNFNDAGANLWPLDQITDTTQYYVRDAVIDYVKDNGTVNPAIEGRLQFTDIQPTTSSTTTTAPTTTTTVPDSTCTLKIIPKKLHKLLGAVEPVKVFIFIADTNSAFSAGAKPVWGADSIKTMAAIPLGKRMIIALVFVRSFALEAGDSAVTVGDCAGSIEIKPF